MADAVMIRWYRYYLDACNRRAWGEIPRFLAPRVLVNGRPRTPAEYVEDLEATVVPFPDYRWELRRALVDGDWLAVRLYDTATRVGEFRCADGDGFRVETDEFVMYRIADGRIHEVEGTADNARLCGCQ